MTLFPGVAIVAASVFLTSVFPLADESGLSLTVWFLPVRS